MTFPVQVTKLIGYSNGLSDVYLIATGPGSGGSGQTAGTIIITGLPTANLAGVAQGNNYTMTIA
jgi:hypothetical protein